VGDTSQRYAIERAKWDAHAHHAAGFKPLASDETFETFCARELLLVQVAAFLGDVRGKDVIEYGCGLGKMSILLARSGARVSAFDISEGSIEVAREQARAYGVDSQITFAVAAAESMPYPDASFDLAFGTAVLHHIEPAAGATELARIMRPGARGAFSEPLGTNPVVKLVREHVPYPHKHERGADIPLRRSDVTAWMAPFIEAEIEGIQLLSMVERGFGFKRSFPRLRKTDQALLGHWPGLWTWCRYGVLTMVR
jgi:2-polyprenyl-3-methyl-5-hydroxy-6-metoxy-1,4-benzoquinol methylase